MIERKTMTDTDEAMIEAYQVATKSPDPSTQTSAVLLRDGEIVSVGFNDFPEGVSTEHWTGPKDGKYARVVHAEVAVLLNAARAGVSTDGTTMVAPWAACANCAKHIAAAGVSVLVRHPFLANGVTVDSPWYPDVLMGDEILREAGVKIVEIDPLDSPVRILRNGALWP